VDLLDHIGPRDHQEIAVAVGRLAAKILGGQVEGIDAGAHRAVEDQYPRT